MEKKKKDHAVSPRRLPPVPFLFLWSLPYALGWTSGFLLYQAGVIDDVSTLGTALALVSVLGLPASLVQRRLLQINGDLDLRGWVGMSMLGWIVGSLLLMVAATLMRTVFVTSETAFVAGQVVAFFALPALAQWSLLQSQVRQAWMWILTGAVSSAAFALPIATLTPMVALPEWMAYITAGATQGLVTGSVMLWLLTMRKPDDATQQHAAAVDTVRLTIPAPPKDRLAHAEAENEHRRIHYS